MVLVYYYVVPIVISIILKSLFAIEAINKQRDSFRISLRWLTYIVNSVDKTKLKRWSVFRWTTSPSENRVRTGHGKPGKSWNLWCQFPGLGSHGILVKVTESHWKAKCFQKIKGKRIKNLKKKTNEPEAGFNFSRNKDKGVFYALQCWKIYVVKWLFSYYCQNKCLIFRRGKLGNVMEKVM